MRSRVLALLLVLWAGGALAQQSPLVANPSRPAIRFLAPSPTDLPLGETRIEVEVTGGLADDELDFFVDGRKIATVTAPPWFVFWQAGDLPRQHAITVAILRSGREISSASLRTREVGFTYAPVVHAVGISPIVTDVNGRPVAGLKPDDFLVFDEGALQKIETFDSNDAPMAVILALDTSGSMLAKRDDARSAAHKFVDALRPDDEAGLCTFDTSIVETVALTQNRAALHAMIDENRLEGDTALYDVAAAALRRLKNVKRRKAVVLFTDAEDNRSRLSVNQVIQMARVTEVSVFSIALGKDESRVPMIFLNQLAEETGGRSYFISNIKRLPEVLGAILSELKSQYFLTYTPRNLKSGSVHRVTVRVARPGAIVRARKEYRIE